MLSKDPIRRFEDILSNIARITEHAAGVNDVTSFEENHLVYDAVERCLERISEAAKKLGVEAEALCPEVPWPHIRGLGNVLRHEYDRVEGSRLWYTLQDDLPPLKAACERVLRELRDQEAKPLKIGYAHVSAAEEPRLVLSEESRASVASTLSKTG